MSSLPVFLLGVASASCGGIAVFFLRYWRQTQDRFFLLFALGFLTLGLNWLLLGTLQPEAEARPFFYLFRLLAFGFIMAAIWDKNRPRRR